MPKIKISQQTFQDTICGAGKQKTLRLGEALVNKFTEDYSMPELFYCDNKKFWDIVFDYFEYTTPEEETEFAQIMVDYMDGAVSLSELEQIPKMAELFRAQYGYDWVNKLSSWETVNEGRI